MPNHSLSHLSDEELVRGLVTLVARERATTASVLAHIGEVDARRLYLLAGFPSMYAYCVHELRLSEDSAFKRIRAARTARQYPAIFDSLARGRLHLSSVVLLTPHLTAENADALLDAATHKTKSEVEQLIAERFPKSESLAMVVAIPASPASQGGQQAGHIKAHVPESSCQLAPGPVEASAPRSRVAPVARERFLLQVTLGQSTRDKLRYAQELLSHRLPSGDIAQVFDLALDALVARLEKRKFATTAKPRQGPRRASANPRHIPAHVRRAVWERDGGRCTFVGESGQRCPARKLLEFDHIDPVARGGRATVAGMRLRCRAHNQFEAERTFGTEFMRNKREEARRAAAARRRAEEVIPYLRRLGFSPEESRGAAARCEAIADASLEERVRRALSSLQPPARVMAPGARGQMGAT